MGSLRIRTHMSLWTTILRRQRLGVAGWGQLFVLVAAVLFTTVSLSEFMHAAAAPEKYAFGSAGPAAAFWQYQSLQHYVFLAAVNAAVLVLVSAEAAARRPTWWRFMTLLSCVTFVVFSPYWKSPIISNLYDVLGSPSLIIT